MTVQQHPNRPIYPNTNALCTNLQQLTSPIVNNETLGKIKIKEYEDYIEEHNNPKRRNSKKKKQKHKKSKAKRRKSSIQKRKSTTPKAIPLQITESNSSDVWDSYVATSSTPTSPHPNPILTP